MNSNISTTYRRFFHLKAITKYGIFTLAFLSMIYCILASCGYKVEWMYVVFFSFAFVLRFILSRAFGLCWVHRACIMYNYCVSVCIVTSEETLDVIGVGKHCIEGATREQVAKYLERDVRTLSHWREKYHDFPEPKKDFAQNKTYNWLDVIEWKIRHKDIYQ